MNAILSEVVKSSGVKDVVSSGCEHCTPFSVSPPIPAAFWVVRINCTLDCLREQDDDVVGFCDFDDTNGLDVCQANIGNRLLAAVEVNVKSAFSLEVLASCWDIDVCAVSHGGHS